MRRLAEQSGLEARAGEPEPEPLEKKQEPEPLGEKNSGAEAAKKIAGSSALRKDKKQKEIVH